MRLLALLRLVLLLNLTLTLQLGNPHARAAAHRCCIYLACMFCPHRQQLAGVAPKFPACLAVAARCYAVHPGLGMSGELCCPDLHGTLGCCCPGWLLVYTLCEVGFLCIL